MEYKRLYILLLFTIRTKFVTKILHVWKTNAKLKAQELNSYKHIVNTNRKNILKSRFNRLRSASKDDIATIFEAKYEKSPTPPRNIFEEIKTSLTKKAIKFDTNVKKNPAGGLKKKDLIKSSPLINKTKTETSKPLGRPYLDLNKRLI
jgi:hypothetical protein